MKGRKKQAQGSVTEDLYDILQQAADDEQRSFSQFVGILIKKGWEDYTNERDERLLQRVHVSDQAVS